MGVARLLNVIEEKVKLNRKSFDDGGTEWREDGEKNVRGIGTKLSQWGRMISHLFYDPNLPFSQCKIFTKLVSKTIQQLYAIILHLFDPLY